MAVLSGNADGAGTGPTARGNSFPCCWARYLSALWIIPRPHPTGFSLSSFCLRAVNSKSRSRAWVAAYHSTVILRQYSCVLALSLLACWVVGGVTNIVSRNTSPQITSRNEVRKQCRFSLGHSSCRLGKFKDQNLCVTQQIDREGARQYSGSGFADVLANAGIPAVIPYLTFLL